jgi:dihydrofolate synthase/folylpolyglutamate synthase
MARFESLSDWLTWQEGFHPRNIDLGLDRVSDVYRSLNPSLTQPVTITVGGTNGKGSCVAYLESIYRAEGYTVGAYTSPHICCYNERIRINGQALDDVSICQAFERIESVRHGVSLSYFEFGTLAALDLFNRNQVDVQILEVGLGGRLDAVNIVDCDVALISTIDIDHADWLGNTREAIGFEKAGIFRQGVPAVIGDPEPPSSIRGYAKDCQALLYQIHKDFTYSKQNSDGHWTFQTASGECHQNLPYPSLPGEHQFRNASSVLMAVELLQSRLPVKSCSMVQGLMKIDLPGRFQWIDRRVPVLLDVAHNPQAVAVLADYLRHEFANRTIDVVFAMMKDKDITGVINTMKPLIRNWYFAPLPEVSRAADKFFMADCFQQCAIESIDFSCRDFVHAFEIAEQRAATNGLILIFGSFFLVSEYLKHYSE